MKKSRIDLSQLKAGVRAKLKRKREPLISPTTSSSKKKSSEAKDLAKECPPPNTPTKEVIPPVEMIPTPPSLPTEEKKPDERGTMVEAKVSSSNLLSLPSTLPRFKEKYTEPNEFSLLMKNVLLNRPFKSGSDIASRTIKHYRHQAKIDQILHFFFILFLTFLYGISCSPLQVM